MLSKFLTRKCPDSVPMTIHTSVSSVIIVSVCLRSGSDRTSWLRVTTLRVVVEQTIEDGTISYSISGTGMTGAVSSSV